MIHLFTASIIEICLFRFINSLEGCPRPALSTITYFEPKKQFYLTNESFYYHCLDRKLDSVFGRMICLPSGRWKKRSLGCVKGQKGKSIRNEEKYGVLVDGFHDTCLEISNMSLNESLKIQVNGVHSRAAVVIFENAHRTRFRKYDVSFFNKSFGDLSNYVKCRRQAKILFFWCDFQKLLENPLILLTRTGDWKSTLPISICEIDIFTEEATSLPLSSTATPPHRSSTVLISTLSTGISLIVFFVLTVVTLNLIKRRKEKEMASKMETDRHHEEENGYEQVKETTCIDLPPQITKSKQRKLSPVHANEFPLTSSSKYLSADKDGYIEQTISFTQRTSEPLYLNEFPPPSSNNTLTDDNGYLEPIRVDRKDKSENPEVKMYYTIPE